MVAKRTPASLAVLAAALAPALAAAAEDAAVPRIEVAGSLPFPDEAPTTGDVAVAVQGLSGVTWLGGDRWAAIMDTGAAFVTFALDLDADGVPRTIRDLRGVPLAARHDDEDVARCPPDIARRCGAGDAPCLLVCEEDTPAVHVIDADGRPIGAVPIPAAFGTRRPNRGLEAVCATADGTAVWVANEEALPADGPPPARGRGTVVRLVELAPAAAHGWRGRHLAYAVDPPHDCVPVGTGEIYSGVVALAAVPDGRLLVLERSAARGLPPFENRLFIVDPRAAADVSAVAGDLAARPAAHAPKRLVWRAALGCNVEGLALGPALAAGGTALVAVADAGGLDAPGRLVVLRMDPPVTSP